MSEQNEILKRGGFITRMETKEGEEPKRNVALSFSSEEPVLRYDWSEDKNFYEVLSHKADDVDLEFLGSGNAPLLFEHDPERQIGVIETVSLSEKKASAVVRLGKGQLSSEVFNDIQDGIKKNVSVGYRLTTETKTDEMIDGVPVRSYGWRPMEISIVSIPADQSANVGIGRKEEIKQPEIKKEAIMSEEVKTIEVVKEVDNSANIRKENAEIVELGKAHGKGDLALEAIGRGVSANEFRNELLNHIKTDAVKTAPIDIKPEEAKRYSLARAINAQGMRNWDNAGFEREISQEMEAKTGKRAQGFIAPDFGWGKRTIQDNSGATYGSGSNVVGQDYLGGSFIDALIAESILGQLGATVLQGLQGDVTIPVMTTASSAVFKAEAVASGNSEPVFGQRTLEARTLTNKIDVSRKMLIQSDPSIDALLRNMMTRAFATKIDNVAIKGGGTAEPTGILSTSGIGDVESAGTGGNADLTWGNCVDIMTTVETANALTGALKWVTHPSVVGKLMQTVRVGSTDSSFIMNDPKSLLGYEMIATTASVSASPYALLYGNFQDLIVGFFSGLDVLVDPYSGGGVTTSIYFLQDLDIAVGQAGSFCASQDVTI